MYENLDINELRYKRRLLINQLTNYKEKKYDGRLIAKFYKELNKAFIAAGGKPQTKDYFLESYWKNPAHRSNEHKNSNPVVDIKDGYCVRKNYQGPIRKTQVPKKIKVPTQTAIPSKSSYYKISISWIDKGPNKEPIIKDMKRFFSDHKLTVIKENTVQIGKDCEHSISYSYEGSEDSFNILKVSAQSILDILSNNDHNIAIQGKKII